MVTDERGGKSPSAFEVDFSEHAREQFLQRAEALHLTPRIEDAWQQAHEIPAGRWCRGDRARFDPVSRCVFPVRDGEVRTALYAPTAKPAIQRAVRNAGWRP